MSPGATAGYSGTPLVRKLGIAGGMRVTFVHAPDDFQLTLGPLGAGVQVRRTRGPVGSADLVVAFFTERRRFEHELERLTAATGPQGTVWVAWPKRAAGLPTDMSDHVVRAVALPTGWVDVKVCAIDDTWTAVKLVLRKHLRPPR